LADLVSIITPSYNSSAYISETILSIISQSYKDWELLITDDCSTDNTIEIVKSFSRQDDRINLFRLEKNSGTGVARNYSMKMAKGRFIAFCDSDDIWLPDKLEKQVTFMNEKQCAFSYTSYRINVENKKQEKIFLVPTETNHKKLLYDNVIGCLTAMYDTEMIEKIDMPTLRRRQDWALWLLITKKCRKAYGIVEPLAIYRERANSISSNKLKLIRYNLEVYRTILNYGFLKSCLVFFILFLPHYFFKKIKLHLISRVLRNDGLSRRAPLSSLSEVGE
jgi:glycosyltransferase involved in cell wall biosynthesis